ncbi:MAG: NDMA-dependent alcohol dehydrogenase [Acidimicrobiia bacterium]
MKTRAALLWAQPGKWEIAEVDLDEPSEHEVLVRMVAAGLCHSDDHFVTGDVPSGRLPLCGGHEGAGVVEAVGSAVRSVEPGDHVVLAFVPSCGRCRWCASGMQNLCDNGMVMLMGCQLDGTYRMHVDGEDVAQAAAVGSFSQYTVVSEWGCIKIDPDVPLAEACLVGCGVPTGWGSAVEAAGVQPGDTHIVMGVGGIGINAVQGARHAGASHIIAVDPVPFKREMATQLGATASFATMDEAADHAKSLTNGQGADSAVVCPGVITGTHIAQAFAAVRKAGTVAVTGVGNIDDESIPISPFELAMFQKRIQGVLFGTLSPSKDVPRLIGLYRAGQLRLSELITRQYTLDQINDGYADMHAGRNIRGVIRFED